MGSKFHKECKQIKQQFKWNKNYEKIAVREARHLGIPIIGVVDTNSDPGDIDFVIPGNDDAMRAIKLYTSVISDTIVKYQADKTEEKSIKSDFVEVNNKL